MLASAKRAIIDTLLKVLPLGLRNAIFHLSFHLARKEFDKFAYEYKLCPDMEFGLAALAARSFSPRSIIDVGAFKGGWSELVRRIWPNSNLVMIEPNLSMRAGLDDVASKLNARVFNELLGATEGQRVRFYVMGPGSSIMEEHSSVPRSEENRILRTLDSLLMDIEAPVLLKIDAQGYELEILRGATEILPKIEAILLEVSIIEINKGAPLLYNVVDFLRQLGFVTYDILGIHRRPLDRALNQIDLIFVREESVLLTDKRHNF